MSILDTDRRVIKYQTVLPLRRGEVIRHRIGTGKLDLIISLVTEDSVTKMELIPVSKCKIIRAIQRWYYLKINPLKR